MLFRSLATANTAISAVEAAAPVAGEVTVEAKVKGVTVSERTGDAITVTLPVGTAFTSWGDNTGWTDVINVTGADNTEITTGTWNGTDKTLVVEDEGTNGADDDTVTITFEVAEAEGGADDRYETPYEMAGIEIISDNAKKAVTINVDKAKLTTFIAEQIGRAHV